MSSKTHPAYQTIAHQNITRHLGQLAGKTVKDVCFDGEPSEGFYGLEFSDGTIAWILCDPEGNGPGHLDIQIPAPQKQTTKGNING